MLESGPLRMKEGILQVIEGGWDEYTTIVFGAFLWEKLCQVSTHNPQSINRQVLDIRIQEPTATYTS